MSMQQTVQPRSSANGFDRRKFGPSSRVEDKLLPGRSSSNRLTGTGITSVSKGAGHESPSRDRLVYLTTCLIGLHVDVHVKNGSVYSGIFHATNADKDFGIILKMARLTKDVSFRGKKSGTDLVSKAPLRTLIIPAHELVQVVAKDVPITRDGLSSELQGESQQDIMLDSYISQSRHVDVGRQLEPWIPDEDTPQRPELENIFDSPWNGRSWDQFKVNESLFGVKSTFNEELYTTKLEKGPRTRELEEKAKRIAREIEGEETFDLHLAEERGVYPHANFDIDEETKYSSVFRGFDDSGCGDEDAMSNSHDIETFGDSRGPSFVRSFADVASGKSGKTSSGLSSKDELLTAPSNSSRELYGSVSHSSDNNIYAPCGSGDDERAQEKHIDEQGGHSIITETVSSSEGVQTPKCDDLQSLSNVKRDGSEKAGVSVSSTTATSTVYSKAEENSSSVDLSEEKSAKARVLESSNSLDRPDKSTSPTLESGAATTAASVPSLSPSSSVGSLSSEKSTLNPYAKEFRLNPKAKSFVPTQSPLRPVSPVNDASFYFHTNMPPVPNMHGMPIGIGVGPSFAGHQPVPFYPQAGAMQPPQAYFPSTGPQPQYGQQMIIGHPRQVMYMPGYPAEMPYKGRDF
ncbi:hypothetical protein RND81_14G177900 [Saponaria officinalis]|uniref:LsmAD domain-containing protein n=1 Tax=Saponaria officinalis TaxID=3572 RepID=A0AAW1GN59_SAPOF